MIVWRELHAVKCIGLKGLTGGKSKRVHYHSAFADVKKIRSSNLGQQCMMLDNVQVLERKTWKKCVEVCMAGVNAPVSCKQVLTVKVPPLVHSRMRMTRARWVLFSSFASRFATSLRRSQFSFRGAMCAIRSCRQDKETRLNTDTDANLDSKCESEWHSLFGRRWGQ